jgi:hypothetical protein
MTLGEVINEKYKVVANSIQPNGVEKPQPGRSEGRSLEVE